MPSTFLVNPKLDGLPSVDIVGKAVNLQQPRTELEGVLMNHAAITTIACTIFLLFSSVATALPPRQGIDLPILLAIKDRARRISFELSPPAEVRTFETIQTIVLDPGHGGENEGAMGVAGILEKYLTLELAYALRDELQKQYPSVRVIMTRYWDEELSLSDRSHIANLRSADLFISLHYNAATHHRAVGFETFYLKSDWVTPGRKQIKGALVAATNLKTTGIEKASTADSVGAKRQALIKMLTDMKRQRRHKESALLARSIQTGLKLHLESTNRGVKQANFTVLKGALMPAIVVEAGFLTHREEGKECTTDAHRQSIVSALLSGIKAFDLRRATVRKTE